MNPGTTLRRLCITGAVTVLALGAAFSQGFNGPLTIQGLDRLTLPSAAARGSGGVWLGAENDPSMMFRNPVSLQAVRTSVVSAGGFAQVKSIRQFQEFAPVRYYSNFSLLMEGLTHVIPDPQGFGFSARDSVQRPYDNIKPNWARRGDRFAPLQGYAALPFSVAGINLVAGAGGVEYADLNYVYQNNNALTPAIFAQRPVPVMRPPDNNPVTADWLQQVQTREGVIHGYGAAISAGLPELGLSVGVSGMILMGTTNEREQLVGRGRFVFFSNSFRLDSVYRRIMTTGKSDYSGQEFTVSVLYESRYASVGVTATLPTEITRSWSAIVETDTTGTPELSYPSGKDILEIPMRGMATLLLRPRENLTIGLEYDLRPYASAVYRAADGTASSPWLSSSVLRVGAELRLTPWLALRGGLREQAEVFEPEGNPVAGTPVKTTIYTAGAGVRIAGAQINVAYEYGRTKYQDIWGSAVIRNSDRRNSIIADISYELSFLPKLEF